MNRRNVLIALAVLTFFLLVIAIVIVVINQQRPSDVSVADVCGNGILDTGEQCDDGNLTNGDGCGSLCEVQPLSCANLNNPYIDFESIPNTTNEPGVLISDQFKDLYGITFSTGSRRTMSLLNVGGCSIASPRLIKKGDNQYGGFEGYQGLVNNPQPGTEDSMGDWLITTATDGGTIPCQLNINFDYPTYAFSFDLWDIDNGEGWTVRAYDIDNKLVRPMHSYTAPVGDQTYGSKPYRFSVEYDTPIYRINVIAADEKPNNVGFGLAFDRFSPYCVNPADATYCGDGTVQTPNSIGNNEQCDDGANGDDTDGCNDQCLNTIQCYSCTDDITDGNACDSSTVVGIECPAGTTTNSNCYEDLPGGQCTTPVCGNGTVETGEQCDDGNTDNNDACSSICEPTLCGDGIVQAPNGAGEIEACDDGNTDDTDACTNSCTLISCGNGVIEAGEQCDDGNSINTDACTNSCQLTICGDGVVQSPNSNNENEQCDDGNSVGTDACSNTCQSTLCGDGIVQTPNSNNVNEQCDDGNSVNGDGCDNSCTTTISDPTPTVTQTTPLPQTAVGDDVSYYIVFGMFFILSGATIYKLGIAKKLFSSYEESIEKSFKNKK